MYLVFALLSTHCYRLGYSQHIISMASTTRIYTLKGSLYEFLLRFPYPSADIKRLKLVLESTKATRSLSYSSKTIITGGSVAKIILTGKRISTVY